MVLGAAGALMALPASEAHAQAFGFGTAGLLHDNAAIDTGDDEFPVIVTDGSGTWISVWESTDPLGGSLGADSDILFVRSTNNGATWSAPAALNTNAVGDAGDDQRPHLATDGAGNWVAVWYSDDPLGGSLGTDTDILVARSSDNGLSWSAPMALSSNATSDSGNDFFPQIATDGSGTWVAAWVSTDSLSGTIGTDADILFARSTDNGENWTAPAPLNTNAATDSGADQLPRLAVSATGTWIAVWRSDDSLAGTIGTDTDILMARSTDSGGTWSAPQALNPGAGSDSASDTSPCITTDGAGNWIALWVSSQSFVFMPPNTVIFYRIKGARSINDGATWAATADLHEFPSDAFKSAPSIVTDGSGTWLAAWESDDTLGGTLGETRNILVSRSSNNGASWTAPAALNTNAPTPTGNNGRPHMATDGAGTWMAVWQSTDTFGDTIGFDEDILFAVSTTAHLPESSLADWSLY
ncbi:MAG: exo-alpha-sialidase [Candidatus Sumerlaeia bacterium]|nr:exo-alpha-sialidase [Candidatus Sumerlaeia bacterium]